MKRSVPIGPNIFDEIARAFPGARVRLMPPSTSGRHAVARVQVDRRVLYAKACVDPHGSADAEIAALRAARASSLAASLVHPRRPARGERWFAATAVPGRAKKSWSVDDVRAIGVALARLHRVRPPTSLRALPGGATLPSAAREGAAAIEILGRSRVLRADDVRAAKRALDLARRRVDAILELSGDPGASDGGSEALCHGDVRAPNVFFSSSKPSGVHLIDFEHAGRGDPAIDLARTCAYERLSRHAFFVLCDAYAEAVRDDAAVDRAIALAPAMALVLALQAARWVADAARGRIAQLDPKAARARVTGVEQRLSELLERPVRLTIGARRPR